MTFILLSQVAEKQNRQYLHQENEEKAQVGGLGGSEHPNYQVIIFLNANVAYAECYWTEHRYLNLYS